MASLETVNYSALGQFMMRVERLMSEQLMMNVNSTAFDGYQVQWTQESDSVACQHTLSHSSRDPDLIVTDLSWNKLGSVISASYGRHDHSSWCPHKGMVCAWNTVMKDFNPEMAFFSLETNVSFGGFHP
jgi:hypothetical protein